MTMTYNRLLTLSGHHLGSVNKSARIADVGSVL